MKTSTTRLDAPGIHFCKLKQSRRIVNKPDRVNELNFWHMVSNSYCSNWGYVFCLQSSWNRIFFNNWFETLLILWDLFDFSYFCDPENVSLTLIALRIYLQAWWIRTAFSRINSHVFVQFVFSIVKLFKNVKHSKGFSSVYMCLWFLS